MEPICSSPSTSSTGSNTEWNLFGEFVTNDELDQFIYTQIHKSAVYQTNSKIQCVFCFNPIDSHKMKQQFRQCIFYSFRVNDEEGEQIKVQCPVRYKVNQCIIKEQRKMANIYESDHSHNK